MLASKRSLIAAAVVALLAMTHAADAAPRPLVTDSKGDAVDPRLDILSANVMTTGTTKNIGGRLVYTPRYVVATVTTAGPPAQGLGQTLTLIAHVDNSCGEGEVRWSLSTQYVPPYNGMNTLVCGRVRTGATETRVVGNTVTWRTALSAFRPIGLGSRLKNFRVYADQGDPVLGLSANPYEYEWDTDAGLDVSVDSARSRADYVLR